MLHGALSHLLKHYCAFVVGYSGTGDIDIIPHLRASGVFFVTRHNLTEPLPSWSERRVMCDLSSSRVSNYPNLLRQLAGLSPAPLREYSDPRCAEQLIRDWIDTAPVDAKQLIRSLLKWRKADGLLHLRHAEHGGCHSGILSVSDASLHLQRGAYRTAFRICSALPLAGQQLERVLEIKSSQAFALWRLGSWTLARLSLAACLPLVEKVIIEKGAFTTQAVEEWCFNICRVYIEVCTDDLQLMPPHLACSMARQWKVDLAHTLLKQLAHPNPQDSFLAEIAGCQVEFITAQHLTLCVCSVYTTIASTVNILTLLGLRLDSYFRSL
jgi:hypothetical protein